jgi:hypothetical protein
MTGNNAMLWVRQRGIFISTVVQVDEKGKGTS